TPSVAHYPDVAATVLATTLPESKTEPTSDLKHVKLAVADSTHPRLPIPATADENPPSPPPATNVKTHQELVSASLGRFLAYSSTGEAIDRPLPETTVQTEEIRPNEAVTPADPTPITTVSLQAPLAQTEEAAPQAEEVHEEDEAEEDPAVCERRERDERERRGREEYEARLLEQQRERDRRREERERGLLEEREREEAERRQRRLEEARRRKLQEEEEEEEKRRAREKAEAEERKAAEERAKMEELDKVAKDPAMQKYIQMAQEQRQRERMVRGFSEACAGRERERFPESGLPCFFTNLRTQARRQRMRRKA
ncbi:MAG: hypothetical protein BJ554DRAFT_2209, partial [Olpidium bornovanus]